MNAHRFADTLRQSWLGQRIRRKWSELLLLWMRYSLSPRRWLRNCLIILKHFSVSILGILVGIVVYWLGTRGHFPVPSPGSLSGFYVAVGGMIGTMIVLVFTLAIIPIQRSADRFSPFVTQLYRNDSTSSLVFVLLALFCLFSFALAIEGLVPLSAVPAIALELVVIAISLDLIRWHQRWISSLLEPQTAIQWLLKETTRDLAKIVRVSVRWARMEDVLPGIKTKAGFAAAVFHQYPLVNSRTDELAWIAHKAIDNTETRTAELAISAMAQIVSDYLDALQQNESIRSVIPVLDVSTVRDRLSSFYEHLKDIHNTAIMRRNEKVSIFVIHALERIASHAAMFDARVFGNFDTTNVAIPLGYLFACSDSAQRNNMPDAVLKASHALKRFTWSCTNHPRVLDIYASVLEQWYKMALAFFGSGNRALANEIIGDMMALAHFLTVREYHPARHVIRSILRKIESLVGLDVDNDANINHLLPLVPYNFNHPASLRGLVAEIVAKYNMTSGEQDDGASNVDCSRLTGLLKELSDHFRNLAERTNVAVSSTFFHIAYLIDYFMETILAGIRLNDCTERDRTSLLDQAYALMSFFWMAFSSSAKKGLADHHNAVSACDSLASFGITFCQAGFPEFGVAAAKGIVSVTHSYCRGTPSPEPFHIADLLIHVYHIELAVRKMADEKSAGDIAKIVCCPKSLDGSTWDRVVQGLELRKAQLMEELSELRLQNLGSSPFKSTDLLAQILNTRNSR
jgi:hypothetical protein